MQAGFPGRKFESGMFRLGGVQATDNHAHNHNHACKWECVKSEMDYWNSGMVEWNILKVYLHGNMKKTLDFNSIQSHGWRLLLLVKIKYY